MTSHTPVRDFLHPRLRALVDEGVLQGFDRDVVVAVLIDMVTSPEFDAAAPDPHADSIPPAAAWDKGPDGPVLLNGVAVEPPPPFDMDIEDNFLPCPGLRFR